MKNWLPEVPGRLDLRLGHRDDAARVAQPGSAASRARCSRGRRCRVPVGSPPWMTKSPPVGSLGDAVERQPVVEALADQVGDGRRRSLRARLTSSAMSISPQLVCITSVAGLLAGSSVVGFGDVLRALVLRLGRRARAARRRVRWAPCSGGGGLRRRRARAVVALPAAGGDDEQDEGKGGRATGRDMGAQDNQGPRDAVSPPCRIRPRAPGPRRLRVGRRRRHAPRRRGRRRAARGRQGRRVRHQRRAPFGRGLRAQALGPRLPRVDRGDRHGRGGAAVRARLDAGLAARLRHRLRCDPPARRGRRRARDDGRRGHRRDRRPRRASTTTSCATRCGRSSTAREPMCTSRDATFPMDDGPWPGTGAIVAAVETATATEAVTIGKPVARHLPHRAGPARAPAARS